VEALKPAIFAFCTKPSERRLEPSALVASSSLPTATDAVRSELSKAQRDAAGSLLPAANSADEARWGWAAQPPSSFPARWKKKPELAASSEVPQPTGCLPAPVTLPVSEQYLHGLGDTTACAGRPLQPPAYQAKFLAARSGVPKPLLAFLAFPGVVHGV